jgi:EF hand
LRGGNGGAAATDGSRHGTEIAAPDESAFSDCSWPFSQKTQEKIMRNVLRGLVPLGLVIASVPFAVAQDEPKPADSNDMDSSTMHHRNMHGDAMGKMHTMAGCTQGLSRLDTDGDGLVSREEFMDAHAEMFAAMDKDGDGLISANERQEMMGRHHDMHGVNMHDDSSQAGNQLVGRQTASRLMLRPQDVIEYAFDTPVRQLRWRARVQDMA